MSRPLRAEISHSALQHNFALVGQYAPGAHVWAVIKANAYGHGALRVAQVLSRADGLALLEIETAIELREKQELRPLLLLEGVFTPDEWELCAEYKLQAIIHNLAQLAWLEEQNLRAPVTVHIKLNTGMNRLGFMPNQVPAVYQRLSQSRNVAAIHWLTHCANADVEQHATLLAAEQYARFTTALNGLPGVRSVANSAVLLRHPHLLADWVRPGIMLYGATPFADRTAAACGVRAVMTLRSEIIAIQTLLPGQGVGYGSRFVASEKMIIGVVACGYADGYPRQAPDGTPILVGNTPTRLIGQVSMDMLTVDLSHVPNAQIGMAVELWGTQVPIDSVAHACGTSGYELMCGIAPRVNILDVD